MFFILKSAFYLTVVFIICLPSADADRVRTEVTRTVMEDKIVMAAVGRTNLATRHAMADAQKYCITNGNECAAAAKHIVTGATGLR